VASGLDPGTIARLIDRHGSLRAAAERAERDPRFTTGLRAINAMTWMTPTSRWDVEHPALMERALRMHVQGGCGRRTLAKEFPGLTEWTAGQLLRWFRVGEPDGLWFDDHDRLQVGARLAPTRDGVRLPRI
jgi:hypothetical protein